MNKKAYIIDGIRIPVGSFGGGLSAVRTDEGDIFIAGGVGHMTRGPLVVSKPSKAFGTDSKMEDSSFRWRFVNPKMKEMYETDPMEVTAENLVEMYNISREAQDKFALASQLKAAQVTQNGRVAKEIVPVVIPQCKGNPIVFDKDEFVRANSTIEALAKLKPTFKKNGTVTAGNASGLNDGAAAVYVESGEVVENTI